MFRKMPFILLAIILAVGFFSPWIPVSIQSQFYAVSLTIKSFILFVLPVIVFGLLFTTAVNLSNKASLVILGILAAICCSNFISTMFSYAAGTAAFHLDLSLAFPSEEITLAPAWTFLLPNWISNAKALFGGLALGLLLGWLKPTLAKNLSSKLDLLVQNLLKAVLITIPFFIVGVIVKMNHDQLLNDIFRNYSMIFLIVISAVFTYICGLYLVANQFNVPNAIKSIKNMLPAAIAGFGSMSSAAAMPLTILGAEKNAQDPDLARSVIPATVNIHLIGDCFAIPIFAFAVMKSFGVDEPAFSNYLIFALYFVLAKFSVAAVPGGGILVMLPVLETYLGFNAEMLSLITALYILFDPVITGANVLGNGAFAMLIERLSSKRKPSESVTT